jgi:electron transfer flavoprotein alpha subunit
MEQSMDNTVIVIAEHADNKIKPVTYEAIACAMELCAEPYSRITIVVPGDHTNAASEHIAQTAGMDVIALENGRLGLYNAEAYLNAVQKIIEDTDPSYIVMPHTSMGYDLAPALAVKLKASCITAAEKINHNKGKHTFIRSMFHGRLYAEVVPKTGRAVITVQPGAWQAAANTTGRVGHVRTVMADRGAGKSRTVEIKHPGHKSPGMAKSEVIVSAGRGIGKKENLSLIHDLAGIFKKAAIGCSRALCDAGWLGYSHQVGATGATVSPKLYFACGISGAIQHISGMRGAQTVVAVNIDPHARIFGIADYCIVEDLTEFIPVLMEEYRTMEYLK